MPDVADLTDLCAAAVQAAGGEAVEAYAVEGRQTTVRARGGEVESMEFAETRGVGVRVVDGGRVGYAHAADPSVEEARGLVASAREAAGFADSDAANVLPEIVAVEGLPGLFVPDQAELKPDAKVAAALSLERSTISTRSEVRKVDAAIYGDSVDRVAIASTAGGPIEYSSTQAWAVSRSLAGRDGETQSGFGFRTARSLEALDLEAVALEAADRAARLLGGRKPETRRVPVILDPVVAAGFLSVLAGALSAEAVLKGRSPLAPLVGETVASDVVDLLDDGRLDAGPSSAPFDDEGVATGRTVLVEGGLLRGFLHNTYTAARQGGGVQSTGNAGRGSYRSAPGVSPTNLFLAPGRVSPAELLGEAGEAVFVQEVSGLHSGASSISGDFSVGATGLRVVGGELGEPLREMTIASTLLEILRGVRLVANDLRMMPLGGGLGAPTLLVGEMTVAGS